MKTICHNIYNNSVTKTHNRNNVERNPRLRSTKIIAFAALMAALANVLSVPPLAITIQIGGFTSAFHFFQLAIFLCSVLAGPWAGLLSGAIGGFYMSVTRIPFVFLGIAILGGASGLFAKKIRPVFACLLAWLVQAPYVLATDYVWFTLFFGGGLTPAAAWGLIVPIVINLTAQAVICAVLADIIIYYVKRAGISI